MSSTLVSSFRLFCSIGLLISVAACGGGGGTANDNTSPQKVFTAELTGALSSLGSSPSSFASFTKFLDTNYKQDGITSAALADMLKADAAAIPDIASFPVVGYSNPVISNCTSANICDLTVTATNSDADLTSTDITLKVVLTGTGYKLLGDQSSS
jgi:hypothetical protein